MAKKLENLKAMNKGELEKTLSDLQENLRTLRFKTEGSKSKNVKETVALKRKIARVLTEINRNNKNK